MVMPEISVSPMAEKLLTFAPEKKRIKINGNSIKK